MTTASVPGCAGDPVADQIPTALVTAVVAPAGSGKTTFVRTMLRERDLQHRWIDVPPAGLGDDFPLVDGRPGLVVVDDSHNLPRTTAGNRAFIDALEHGWRFVFIGRTEPPASFWRLMGRGEGVMVGFEDLLLTESDIATMAAARGLEQTPELWADLHRSTRGWAALVEIVLDAIVRSGVTSPTYLPLTEASRYLRAEVIDQLPEELRLLCVRLAHVGVFTPDLARELLGDTDGSFDRALRSQSMVVRAAVSTTSSSAVLTRTPQWTFPPLLEEALRADRTAPSPVDASVLHRSASRWHEGRGEWDRALAHMVEADPSEAVRQLGRLISAMEPLGRTEEALQWFRQLPRRLRVQPASVVALASALVQAGLASEARQLLDQVDSSEWTDSEMAEAAVTESMVDRVLVRHGDAVAGAERALVLLAADSHPQISAGRLAYLRVMAVEQLRDIRLWEGNPAQVRELMARVEGDLIRSGQQLSLVHSTAVTAMAALDSGDLVLAADKAGVALRLAMRREFQDTHIVAEAHFVLGAIAAEHDEIDSSIERLTHARSLAKKGIFPTTVFRVELLLAPLLARAGRIDEAWAVLEALGEACRRTEDSYLPVRLQAAQALVSLHAGDTKAARIAYTRLTRTNVPSDVVRISMQLAAGLGSDTDFGGHARALPEPHEPIDAMLTAMTESACLLDRDRGQAAVHLISALRIAERANLWRSVLTFSARSGPLLADVRVGADVTSGPSPSFVRRFATVVKESIRDVSVLSAREVEIAQYLPTRKTNPQIAAELYISENTIKTHIRHIYQKLGVEQRDDAVNRLEQLGVLGTEPRR